MTEQSDLLAAVPLLDQPPLPDGHRHNPLALAIAETRRLALRAPPRVDLVEWADEFRYLSREASSTGGKWDTSRVEVARGVMMAFSEPGVMEITTMVSVQLLKTEFQLNGIAYKIHISPGPMLVVLPDEASAQTWSQTRLASMIRDTPVLKERIDQRRKTSANTWSHKEFPGGQIDIVSAQDPAELAQRPVETIFFDEVDKFPKSSGKEGNPLDIACERMTTFALTRKAVYACSPTLKGESLIEAKFLKSDQRRPFMPCPACGHEHVLEWKHVVWDKEYDEHGAVVQHFPETATVQCENPECRHRWSEAERLATLPKIVWRQTRKFTCCGVPQDPVLTRRWEFVPERHVGYAVCTECGQRAVSNAHAGFHAWKVHSPWEPVTTLAKKFLEARSDPEKLKVFVNTQLGETFEDARRFETTAEALLARREIYHAEVPAGVGLLTMGVDTHDNRLEYEVVGWGMDEESWGIERGVIGIDPSEPEAWRRLDEVRTRLRTREDGRTMAVMACCVDYQGHRSEHVAGYCVPRSAQNVWAVRGKAETSDVRAPLWPRKPTVRTRGRVPLYEVGTQAGKDTLFSRIGIGAPGPGYMHFPAHYDLESLEQLTVERLVRKTAGSRRYQVWECPSWKRNETTDCRVYAMAALAGLKATGRQLNRTVLLSGATKGAAPVVLADQAADAAPSRPPVPAGGLAAQAVAAISPQGAPRATVAVESTEPTRTQVKTTTAPRRPNVPPRRSTRW